MGYPCTNQQLNVLAGNPPHLGWKVKLQAAKNQTFLLFPMTAPSTTGERKTLPQPKPFLRCVVLQHYAVVLSGFFVFFFWSGGGGCFLRMFINPADEYCKPTHDVYHSLTIRLTSDAGQVPSALCCQ